MNAPIPLYITGACRGIKHIATGYIAQRGKCIQDWPANAHMLVTTAKNGARVQGIACDDASMLLVMSVEMICDNRALGVKINSKVCGELPQLV